jgi:hypothetical protein
MCVEMYLQLPFQPVRKHPCNCCVSVPVQLMFRPLRYFRKLGNLKFIISKNVRVVLFSYTPFSVPTNRRLEKERTDFCECII